MNSNGDQRAVVGKMVVELVRIFATSSVGMAMCINSAIPRWCLTEILELDYFGVHLCRK